MLTAHRPLGLAALGLAGALCASALPAEEPVQGSFLVANRDLGDPNFSRTVVLLVRRDDEGTIGLIINRASDVELSSVLPELDGPAVRGRVVYFGGPVATHGMHLLLRSTAELDDSFSVFDDVRLSSSMALLEQLVRQKEIPFRVYAGYSGWAPGQLENEIARGDWLVRPGDAGHVFFEGGKNLPWPTLAPQDPRDRALVDDPGPPDQGLSCPSASRITSSGTLPG